MPEAGDITKLLQEAERGNIDAANELFLLVQDDLKQIVRKRKRMVGTLTDASTTVLVDDVFLRLVGKGTTLWQPGDRRKFFGYASHKIHDMLIDLLREQDAAKRGGKRQPEPLPNEVPTQPANTGGHLELLIDLKEALDRLEAFALEDASLFRIRFFLNCTFEEAADIMGVSKTEAVRSCRRTQLWLQREMKEYRLDS